jgi:hypothetical protein
MKKLMTMMLGMTLLFGTVSAVFGQEKGKDEPKKATKKKSTKKKAETPKKDGGK